MILHITTRAAWQAAEPTGVYRPDSLDSEGFTHCSTPVQILMPANAMFRGQQGLILLCIDPAKVRPRIVYEDLYQTGHAFPHIYGPLNTDAILKAVHFPPNADGTFDLPPEVATLAADYDTLLDYPILEYDPAPEAILEPGRILSSIDIPEHCVLCFFQDVITDLNDRSRLRQIYELGSEVGPNPVFEVEVDGRRLAITHAGVGASMSAARCRPRFWRS
jgi:uncharacterized protein (DUF952 family)